MEDQRRRPDIRGSLVAFLALAALWSGAGISAAGQDSVGIGSGGWSRFHALQEYEGEAVLDTQTGLIWEQSPTQGRAAWSRAKSQCGVKIIGSHRGWRLPSFFELMTLVEPSFAGQTGTPLLPTGHPFNHLVVGVYWSSETTEQDPGLAYVVDFLAGDVATREKTMQAGLWCVKGSPTRSISHASSHELIRWHHSSTGPVLPPAFLE